MAGVYNANGQHPVVLVCEHASAYMPEHYNFLGLDAPLRQSHIAWDPGALSVAKLLARKFDSPLVHSNASRLLYDCNRPPEAQSAIPSHSESHTIPGNVDLSTQQREERANTFYEPFRTCLRNILTASKQEPVIVTVHSFTPVYNGVTRTTELGILHDTDTRLADALLGCVTNLQADRNQPYGPADGVTHTLREHALPNNYLNVMLEVRSDLIETASQQESMAMQLASWLTEALMLLNVLKLPVTSQRQVPL